jgi:ATP-dependent protease ClpP protease subunit
MREGVVTPWDTSLKFLETVHEYGIDPRERRIYLTGGGEDKETPEIDYQVMEKFLKNLHYLETASVGPITIHMNTCGGDWDEGMAIYNAIRSCECRIEIINHTYAASMASILLQAGDRRVMGPDSYFMFHQGDFYPGGTFKQTYSQAAFYKASHDRMLEIYLGRILSTPTRSKFKTWSRERMKDHMVDLMNRKEDVYLTAEDTVAWGLADGIA